MFRARLTQSIQQFCHSHEACHIHGRNGTQCLHGLYDCPFVKSNMPLAPPQMENTLQTSTAHFQTVNQPYLPTTSEPSASASSTCIPTPSLATYNLGPQQLSYPLSNPVYISYGAPQPSSKSSLIYGNITSGLVWTPPPIDMTNIPRNSEWTTVCGIVSAGADQVSHKSAPETPVNTKLKYHCPRCDKCFTRRYTVKQHFTGCINRHGNPKGLKWVDHSSLDLTASRYATRKPNGWNLHRSKTRNQRFPQMAGAAANEAEPRNP